MIAIPYGPDPYVSARAIDRALEGWGWRVVVMHAEQTIRIAARGASLFADNALVLVAGEQLNIGEAELAIVPVTEATA